MGGEEGLDAVQVSDDARCQLWTGSGAESGLVSIKIAALAHQRGLPSARLQQTQETLLLEALDRSLRAQGYRVLAPTGPKPESYQDTTYARTLVGEWSEGPCARLWSDGERAYARGREREERFIRQPPGARLNRLCALLYGKAGQVRHHVVL